MMTKITPVVIAVAAIAGLVVAYSLRTSITPEARRGTPVENEHTKTVLVHSQTDFDEVNSPSVKDVRSANRVLSPVASRPEPRRRPPADEQEEILRNRRVPDTPTREDTQPEVTKAIAVPQPKGGSSEVKPVEQFQATTDSDDDDDEDDDDED
jgi:hypothetical protein